MEPLPVIGFRLYRQSNSVALEPVPDAPVLKLPVGTTSVTWTGLQKTDSHGNPFTFSVHEGTWNADKSVFTEGAPAGYIKTEKGLYVTNTGSLIPYTGDNQALLIAGLITVVGLSGFAGLQIVHHRRKKAKQ